MLRRLLPIRNAIGSQKYLFLALLLMLLPDVSFAGSTSVTAGVSPGTCSSDPQFNIPIPAAGAGVITTIVSNIQCILWGGSCGLPSVSESMFNTIASNTNFMLVVKLSLVLFVMITAVLFTFGLIQLSATDMTMRLVKISIVAALITPSLGWNFFYNYVGVFFNDGTDALIGQFTAIAFGMGNMGGAWSYNQPFILLDNAIALMTSSRMAVTLVALFFTGPYGLIFGILILIAIGTFAGALFQAIWIYLMSLVIRAFLFALAPIFFCFLLFQRTRSLFDGWLNQIVSACLQPIFLFAFFAFFARMVVAAMYQIMRVPVCWMPPGEVWRGTPFDVYAWRFSLELPAGSGIFYPYSGAWSFTGTDFVGAPIFPIDIVDVIVLLILAQLAWRFNGVVLNIAKDIAGASTGLDFSPGIGDMFNRGQNFTKSMTKKSEEARQKVDQSKEKTTAGQRPGVPGAAAGVRPGAPAGK